MPTSKKYIKHTVVSSFYMLDALDETFMKDVAENKDFQEGILKVSRVMDFFKKEAHFTVNWQKTKDEQPIELGYLQVQEVPHESGGIRAFKFNVRFEDLKDSALVLVEVELPDSPKKEVAKRYKVLKAFTLFSLKAKGVAVQANLEELFAEIGKTLPVTAKTPEVNSQPADNQENKTPEVEPETQKPAQTSAEA